MRMPRARTLALPLLLYACGGAAEPGAAAPPPPQPSAPPRADTVVFTGACDASGAVPLGPKRFAVADDERNELYVYDADRGGAPIAVIDVSAASGPDDDEMDLEAATRIGDRALWLASHGRNKKGKPRPARLRLFATTASADPARIALSSRPYTELLDALIREPALARFDLATAATRAPKAPGGLSIEGMTARPEGGVVIGFRNPVPEGRALIVTLENPLAVLEGEAPRFGAVQEVDLGGLGVRGLSWWRGDYLIAAGAIDDGAPPRLFRWDGKSPTPRPVDADLSDLNPEGFFSAEDRDRILVLSDDGTRRIGEKKCKKVDDPAMRQFRGRWINL